ncbi:MAG: hypothetical protein ACERKZ_16680 [Lachnotalea sp.]
MLMQKPTPEMYEEWKAVWNQYRDKLKPNRKSGQELIDYLSKKYILTEIHDKKAYDVVRLSVTMNEVCAEKLPPRAVPIPKTYYVENLGNGSTLYENVDEIFKDIEKIIVGIDLTSGWYMVEGNSMLWDELCAFQGLDEVDIQNFFCVAQYVACLKRFGRLKNILLE